MSSQTTPLDQAQCNYLVTQYLLGQGWDLVNPQQLAKRVWRRLKKQGLAGDAAIKAVQQETWQLYGETLHDCCRRPDHEGYEKAWTELRAFLSRQAHRLESYPQERERLVQETSIDLQARLNQAPIETPRAFLVYVLNAMRTKNIDLHRRRTAVKRGEDKTLSLEEIGAGDPDEDRDNAWEKQLSADKGEWRTMETAVANAEVRRQLQSFFSTHLPTDLQQQVAEAHFLDGLSPAEIAQLMSKQPHEIRMVKARVVQKLRNLAPKDKQQLLDILGRLNTEETDES